MESDETLDFKQNYLRQEIMEKDYDPEEFLAFFQEQRDGYDLDLDYITYVDLQKIVEEFQNYCRSNSKESRRAMSSLTKQEDNVASMEKIGERSESKDKIENSKLPIKKQQTIILTEDNEIDEMILCQKIDKSPLYGHRIVKIEITKTTQNKGGLFQSSYTTYTIVTSGINTEVTRRYKDFDWLRDELKHQFPGMFVRFF